MREIDGKKGQARYVACPFLLTPSTFILRSISDYIFLTGAVLAVAALSGVQGEKSRDWRTDVDSR